MQHRHLAYSVLDIKAVGDGDQRQFSGIATTPKPDRIGDIVEPLGVKFKNPLPLLLFHDSRLPVGSVTFKRATEDGIEFDAELPDIREPGTLRDRVEEAYQSIKAGLIRGVSIGFRALKDGIEVLDSGGLRFLKSEVLELSLVVIPANQDATITTIKSIDESDRAALGVGPDPKHVGTSRGRGTVVRLAQKDAPTTMKNISERKAAFVAEKEAKIAKLNELMGDDDGTTLEADQQDEFDALETEIETIDKHLARLETVERVNKAAAKVVDGTTIKAASDSRNPAKSVRVQEPLPPGHGFARAVKAAVVARIDSRNVVEVAREMYPSDDRVQAYVKHLQVMKAAVPAGSSTATEWAAPLVDPTNLAAEFIEYLRPATIIGKFGTTINGVAYPSLRAIPFNVRMVEQTEGGTGYWVGQGAPKPLTKFAFSPVTNVITKVAAISVITEELARLSTPSAEGLVRDGLRDALVERIDRDFIDPAQAGSTNVQPASITNGVTALTTAGTSADNARTDLTALMTAFTNANLDPSNVVLIMPTTLAMALSFQVNSLGQPEFPNIGAMGGRLNGIPVITSQYAANASGYGNMVIAVNAREVFLSDDGQVMVDASREASLQMLDNPTNTSVEATAATSMVSMWQTNSIALRAERFINWSKRRTDAVSYLDDVNWFTVGSPS